MEKERTGSPRLLRLPARLARGTASQHCRSACTCSAGRRSASGQGPVRRCRGPAGSGTFSMGRSSRSGGATTGQDGYARASCSTGHGPRGCQPGRGGGWSHRSWYAGGVGRRHSQPAAANPGSDAGSGQACPAKGCRSSVGGAGQHDQGGELPGGQGFCGTGCLHQGAERQQGHRSDRSENGRRGYGNVTANLMLDYVERKMPVGDQKMLAMVASFAASGWRAARDEGNISLEGWMAKLLVFCDQSSVEGGRTQLPWLLTGLSDPNFAAMNRRRQGIRPFRAFDPERLDVGEPGLYKGDGLLGGPDLRSNFQLRHRAPRPTGSATTGGGRPPSAEKASTTTSSQAAGHRVGILSQLPAACQTSDANSGVSTGQAELCPNSFVSEFLGPSGPSSRRVPVWRKSPCRSSGLPSLGSSF